MEPLSQFDWACSKTLNAKKTERGQPCENALKRKDKQDSPHLNGNDIKKFRGGGAGENGSIKKVGGRTISR